MAPLTAEVARELKLPPDLKGVVVTDVVEGGPAEQAGVARGDVILELNQQAGGQAAATWSASSRR